MRNLKGHEMYNIGVKPHDYSDWHGNFIILNSDFDISLVEKSALAIMHANKTQNETCD